jgi:hypothetical protein
MLGIRTTKVAVFLLPRTIEVDSPEVHVHCKFLTNITSFITGFPAPVARLSFMYMAVMLSSYFSDARGVPWDFTSKKSMQID